MSAPVRPSGVADWPPSAPPCDVNVGGDTLHIRAVDSVTLLGIVADGSWPGVLPGLLDEDSAVRLWSRWLDDDDDLDWGDVFPVATSLMTRFSGCDWWGAQRILAIARAHWFEFDAHCAGMAFDPHTGPVYRTTAVAYAWLVEQQIDHSDNKKTTANLARLEQVLWTPPPWLAAGSEPVAPWTPEEESAGFFAAMNEQL